MQIHCCRRKTADLHLQRVSAEALGEKISKAGSTRFSTAVSILFLWKGGTLAELKASWSIWSKYIQTCKVPTHIYPSMLCYNLIYYAVLQGV